MIPIYILPIITFILFVLIGIGFRKNKENDLISNKKKIITVVLFLLMIFLTVIFSVLLCQKGKPTKTTFTLMKSTVKTEDITVIDNEKQDGLIDGKLEILKGNNIYTFIFKDNLFNKSKVHKEDIISMTTEKTLNENEITISKCLAKEKIGIFWKYTIKYKISLPEDPH